MDRSPEVTNQERDPADTRPWVMVLGPHSSGTRIHVKLVADLLAANGDPWIVEHFSLPYEASIPTRDKYIWVQRDPHITALSQEVRGYGTRQAKREGREFEGFHSQVWKGIAQGAELFQTLRPDQFMFAWYNETLENPYDFAHKVMVFLGLETAPAGFGDDLEDMSAKYVQPAIDQLWSNQ